MNIAITAGGQFIMLEDARGGQAARPLELTDAATRVRARRGRAPLSTRYTYFHNPAESGISICRPLVAVATEKGDVYFNSQGDAFVEDGGALADEWHVASVRTPLLAVPGAETGVRLSQPLKRLAPAGRW
jgi:hypothetical protein